MIIIILVEVKKTGKTNRYTIFESFGSQEILIHSRRVMSLFDNKVE